jgi:hypothetical protein
MSLALVKYTLPIFTPATTSDTIQMQTTPASYTYDMAAVIFDPYIILKRGDSSTYPWTVLLTAYTEGDSENSVAIVEKPLKIIVSLCDDTATLISTAVESLTISKGSTFTAIDLTTKFSMVITKTAAACTGTHTIALSSTAATQTALTGLAAT